MPAARGQIKRLTVEARIVRADGRVEELGVIADSKHPRGTRCGAQRAVKAVTSKVKEVVGRGERL